ncbi:hypothetical protein KALB_7648 [Kutzneria albida DSM 43870]|uniref:Uncharacterized protein n=1 Tax=Kutzneria albida DSM 43870 TaxID=1449976 RepID=W5WJT7_9PSEU|nr:hypothetical protein KALB_7648 [Kutzneria albida DSM 43870]
MIRAYGKIKLNRRGKSLSHVVFLVSILWKVKATARVRKAQQWLALCS